MHTPGDDIHVQWGGGRFHVHVIMVQVICMEKVSTISKTHGEKRRGEENRGKLENRKRERRGGGRRKGEREKERRVMCLPARSSYF